MKINYNNGRAFEAKSDRTYYGLRCADLRAPLAEVQLDITIQRVSDDLTP